MNKMYTILINDDNSLTKSIPERIMHRSHNVNTIRFLMNPTYTSPRTGEELDMSTFTVTMEYTLPISKQYKPIILTAEPELYKDRLCYMFPVTGEFTAEPGDIELKFVMTKADMLEDGTKVGYVRRTEDTFIHITPVKNWDDQISSADLGTLAEALLEINSKAAKIEDLANQLHKDKVADIVLDAEEDSLYLVDADGSKVGNGVTQFTDGVVDAADDGLIEVII